MVIVNYNDKNGGYHIEPFPNTCGDNRQLPYYSNEASLNCEESVNEKMKINNHFNNFHWYETYRNGRNSFNVQNVDCYRTYASGTDNYYVIS